MNILHILQQSIYNNDSKWLTSDSNIDMTCGILRELVVKRPDWNHYVLIAPLHDFADITSYDEIFKHENVNFIPYPFIVDAFLNRQNFSIKDFDRVFSSLPKIDLVWNNLTEVSRNIKTYLFQKKSDAKLITACYWMDTPEIGEEKVDPSISYQYRQFDGYECSDIVVFTCNSTKKAFFDNAEKVFVKEKITPILDKSVIWDFGFSTKEADQYRTNEKFDKKTILFLNRLSGINYTHHLEFIEAVNRLYEKRQDFQVIFTNPSQKANWDELKQQIPALHVYKDGKALNRQEYFELLWKADVSFHGYLSERYGGVANTESIYCNNITVMPEVYEYARRGGPDYPFYVKNDFSNLETMLGFALDRTSIFLNSKVHNEMKQRNLESAFETISDKVISDIEKLFF